MSIEKRDYYSSRNKRRSIDINQLYKQFISLYSFFFRKDYFVEKLFITPLGGVSDDAKHLSVIEVGSDIFPISDWKNEQINEDKIFDAIEFFYHYVSKPGKIVHKSTADQYNYMGYEDYDTVIGQGEFREKVNMIIRDYGEGFEISENGQIQAIGDSGLEEILNLPVIEYDLEHIDRKVEEAITKWKDRRRNLGVRKSAIRDLADVFEWLKKTGKLEKALQSKDESDLFSIANNFSIRHHTPDQKGQYDPVIWYSWMFH